MRRFIAILGLSLASAAPAAVAPAQAETYAISIPVRAADLESDHAVRELYQRVVGAVDTVCAEMNRDAFSGRRPLGCRSELLAHAIADAGIPALSQYHAAILAGRSPDAGMEVAAS